MEEIKLETVTDVAAENPGIDIDFAQAVAVQPGLGIDIEIAYIGIEEPVIIEHDVKTNLATQAPAVAQLEVSTLEWTSGFLAEEGRVVQADANIRLELFSRPEVVLQTDGRR